jgi:hypothetical protein
MPALGEFTELVESLVKIWAKVGGVVTYSFFLIP